MMNYSITEDPKQTAYCGIDLIKFVCAFLIIAIHVSPLSSYNRLANYGIQQYLARLAVPFYFAASGFFVFRKNGTNEFSLEPSFSFAKKLLRLYGTWMALLLVGGRYHLWYMTGAVVAVLLVSLMRYKHIPIKGILLISALLYTVGLLGDSYFGFISSLERFRPIHYLFAAYRTFFITTRNGLFMGMAFVTIGMLFAVVPIRMKGRYAIGGLCVSLILLLVEAIALKWFDIPKECNMYVCLVPSTFFLFYIATHIKLENKKIYGVLRSVGALMFYSHLLVNYFVGLATDLSIRIGAPNAINNSLVRYCAVALLSLVFSMVIYRLSQIKHLRWLRWIYS